MAPRLLTERYVAEMTGLAVGTLRNWRSMGVGPRFIKLGRAVRYDEAELARWVTAGARDVAPGWERTPKGLGKSKAGSTPSNTNSEPTANAPQTAGASEDVTV